MIIKDGMNVLIVSDFEVISWFNELDVIFEWNFLYVSFLSKVLQSVFVEGLNVFNFRKEFVEFVSSQNFSYQNRAVLFEQKCRFVNLLEKAVKDKWLRFLWPQSIMSYTFPNLSWLHFFNYRKHFLLVFVHRWHALWW